MLSQMRSRQRTFTASPAGVLLLLRRAGQAVSVIDFLLRKSAPRHLRPLGVTMAVLCTGRALVIAATVTE